TASRWLTSATSLAQIAPSPIPRPTSGERSSPHKTGSDSARSKIRSPTLIELLDSIRRGFFMYDAIVVGARCAGSPLSMLLARKGYKVLIVDRATFPSDSISTHFIWPTGVDCLQRWGLLDRLHATGCPPVHRMGIDLGPFQLEGAPPPIGNIGYMYGPRRTVLDKLLLDA